MIAKYLQIMFKFDISITVFIFHPNHIHIHIFPPRDQSKIYNNIKDLKLKKPLKKS